MIRKRAMEDSLDCSGDFSPLSYMPFRLLAFLHLFSHSISPIHYLLGVNIH